MQMSEKEFKENMDQNQDADVKDQKGMTPPIMEEITIEELAVDGICGIY